MNKKINVTLTLSSATFFVLLTIAFVVLKLCGVITWSWAWVFAPLWIPVCIGIVIFVIILIVYCVLKFIRKIMRTRRK